MSTIMTPKQAGLMHAILGGQVWLHRDGRADITDIENGEYVGKPRDITTRVRELRELGWVTSWAPEPGFTQDPEPKLAELTDEGRVQLHSYFGQS